MEIGKEVKHPFLDDMRLSIRDTNDSTRKLLEMINLAISRMQNQCTQINTFSIHQQQAHIGRTCGHATIHRSLQENKLRINLTKEVKCLSENTCCAECGNGHSIKSYLQIQCDPDPNLHLSHHRNYKEKTTLKFIMEPQNILGKQNNPDQKEKCWRYYHSVFRNITVII